MNQAAYHLARSKETSEPMLVNVLLASRINRALGGALIAPWEVDDMTDEMIEAVLSLERVSEYSEGLAKVEGIFANWRKKYGRQHQ